MQGVRRPSRTAELTLARRAMACEFSVVFPAGARNGVEAGFAALDEVERLEQKLSVFLDDSELSCINRSAEDRPVRVDDEVYGLLRVAHQLATASGGAFDAAAGALVKAWGFYRGPRQVPSEPERLAALAASGWRQVEFDDERRTVRFRRHGVEFNLGSIGKGFAIDRALDRLRCEFGIRSAFMQGGQSSLRALGSPPGEFRGWTVAVGDPARPGKTAARVRLRNRAMGTSGAANQFFVHEGRKYGHVLDPRTGRPACGLLSATAIAPTAMEADALSTAFFVMGVEGTRQFCQRHRRVAAVLILDQASPRIVVCGEAELEVLL